MRILHVGSGTGSRARDWRRRSRTGRRSWRAPRLFWLCPRTSRVLPRRHCEVRREHFTLPKALQQRLRALGAKEQVTPFMLLEAAFASLLHRHSGQADILVGTPISGRTQSETQRMVGCFLNTVVLRSQFAADRPSVRCCTRRAIAPWVHSPCELPFGRLVATAALDRDPSRSPLFQVMFVLHDPEGASQVSYLSGHRELETGRRSSI